MRDARVLVRNRRRARRGGARRGDTIGVVIGLSDIAILAIVILELLIKNKQVVIE